MNKYYLSFFFCVASVVVESSRATIAGDLYSPFEDFRVVDPTSRMYVVVRRLDGPFVKGAYGPVEMLVAQRGLGTPPAFNAKGRVEPSSDEDGLEDYEIISTVGVRDGDRIVKRHRLRLPPISLVFLGAPERFVAIGEEGSHGAVFNGGPAVRIYALYTGQLKLELPLTSFLEAEEIRLLEKASSHWMAHAWRDTAQSEKLFIAFAGDYDFTEYPDGIAQDRRVVSVNVVSGEVVREHTDVVAMCLSAPYPGDLETLIKLSAEIKLTRSVKRLKEISVQAESEETRSLAIEAIKSIESSK